MEDLSPQPLSEKPPFVSRALAGWRIYLVTVLMLPLSTWLTAMILAVLVAATIGWRMLQGELGGADFGYQAQLQLNALLANGVVKMVVGVFANSASFGCVALILASRAPGRLDGTREDDREEARRRLRERLRLGPAHPRDFALAALGLVGLTVMLDSLIVLAGLGDYGALAEMRDVVARLSMVERLLLGIVVAAGAGIAEELFFRGYMMSALGRIHGAKVALVVSSIAFGAFHLDPLHSPVAGLMGAFLGVVALTTGSLWPAAFAHFVNNLSALIFAEAEATPRSLAVFLAPIGLVVCALALWALRRLHRGERHPPVW